MRRDALTGWRLLMTGIFMVSVFIIALKLMNPTEIHIHLEGEETVLSQVLRNYTLYDIAMVIVAAFFSGVSVTFLTRSEPKQVTGETIFEQKRASYDKILPTLKEYEQKVFQAILDAEGIIAQSEISEITGVSRSNVTRALDLLESRGLVERRRRGMGNVIFLK